MSHVRDDAIVLRAYKLGEADRIIVMLTRGRGQVRAVAKGVRRTKSKFGSRLEPGSIVHVQLYEGRGDLDIVTQAETRERLPSLRSDLSRYGRLSVMLEAVDRMSADRSPDPALHKLLLGAMRELDRSGHPLVVAAFVVKLLTLEGLRPSFDGCVTCGRSDELVAFDVRAGGATCRDDRQGEPLSPETFGVLALVAEGRIREAMAATDELQASQLEMLCSTMLEHQLEHRLKAPAVARNHLSAN